MPRLTKEQLKDRSRYQFKTEDVPLPELGEEDGEPFTVAVKTLSVAERDALPDLTDDEGEPDSSVPKLARLFAAVVSEPKLSVSEAEEFLGELPSTAFDRIVEAFSELVGSKDAEGKR